MREEEEENYDLDLTTFLWVFFVVRSLDSNLLTERSLAVVQTRQQQ